MVNITAMATMVVFLIYFTVVATLPVPSSFLDSMAASELSARKLGTAPKAPKPALKPIPKPPPKPAPKPLPKVTDLPSNPAKPPANGVKSPANGSLQAPKSQVSTIKSTPTISESPAEPIVIEESTANTNKPETSREPKTSNKVPKGQEAHSPSVSQHESTGEIDLTQSPQTVPETSSGLRGSFSDHIQSSGAVDTVLNGVVSGLTGVITQEISNAGSILPFAVDPSLANPSSTDPTLNNDSTGSSSDAPLMTNPLTASPSNSESSSDSPEDVNASTTNSPAVPSQADVPHTTPTAQANSTNDLITDGNPFAIADTSITGSPENTPPSASMR